ncbi:glycoside hydrolase family 55 protein [Acaryochloris sp. IP29b_bin.137]|uniref:glycoside hydrolase family 55 protein n=1 Tax=Acaryochloris sp. IP29b_bin.137 TaxID=2969217 RepID=UPI00262FC32E|nr:glycoside hydrolase family 55 protein [Acaryochloris sp. IP29b_bin.137]
MNSTSRGLASLLLAFTLGCTNRASTSTKKLTASKEISPQQEAVEKKEDPEYEKVFPEDVGWINIKEEFGAVGDGKTDDTNAILRAIQSPYKDYTRPKVLYFPTGTYLVKSTLLLTGKRDSCCVTFQGQGQGKTIIKLIDSAPGFGDPQKPKPVIKTRAGNVAFRHYFRDFTLQIGQNNAGAIGLDYISSNRGAIKNIAIKSTDGSGIAGLLMTRRWPGPSLIKHVLIEGFDHGIHVKHPEYGLTFEHITLKNQKHSGILNHGNTLAILDLKSINSVPAILNRGRGLVILVNGNLQGGSSKHSAIINNASLYARNIQTQGYQTAIQSKGKVIPSPSHTEFIAGKVYSLFDSPKKSLHLPIEPTPTFHDQNLNNWANVKRYPSIQAAMNSGKSTIYFPRGNYKIGSTINIPATVRKVIGYESFINLNIKHSNTIFQVNEDSNQPLIFEGLLFPNALLKHHSSRTVVIKHSKGPRISNSPKSGKLFLEDVQLTLNLDYPQNIWARQLNAESLHQPRTKVLNNGGNLWILGIKTEGKGSVIETTNGGKTELLGTLIYPVRKFSAAEKNQAAFINNESSHTLIYSVSAYGPLRNYPIQIKEVRNGITRILPSTEMTSRAMPLFSGFKD